MPVDHWHLEARGVLLGGTTTDRCPSSNISGWSASRRTVVRLPIRRSPNCARHAHHASTAAAGLGASMVWVTNARPTIEYRISDDLPVEVCQVGHLQSEPLCCSLDRSLTHKRSVGIEGIAELAAVLLEDHQPLGPAVLWSNVQFDIGHALTFFLARSIAAGASTVGVLSVVPSSSRICPAMISRTTASRVVSTALVVAVKHASDGAPSRR